MPPARPVHVVSFSSEDPNNPASNLLKGETFRKWKCKEPGEKLAYVIMKLEKAETISSLDIGNEHSAFVEVLVGRSGQVPQKFEVLLSHCAFMTPTDSRNSSNPNRVRMFGLDKLDKLVAAQKWDLVKVVCTQEFNTHVQFGLSFINVNVAADPNEKPKIGAFAIRPALGDVEEVTEPVRMGGLFAKRLQEKDGSSSPRSTSTTSAAIRAASSSLANAAFSSNADKVKELKKQKLIPDSSASIVIASTPSTSKNSSSRSKSPEARNKSWSKVSSSTLPRLKGRNHEDDLEDGVAPSSLPTTSKKTHPSKVTTSSAHSTNSSTSSKKKSRQTKQFSKLFEDVVFVMSGFQNPYRASLRTKAVEMGARCKPDWDFSCTHLICAFVNTPKFREVRQSGHGKIVKKEWIEASYTSKCRMPWRRFCLDRNDRGDESEEEIHADLDEDDEMEIEDDMLNRQGSGDDDNEDIHRVRALPVVESKGENYRDAGETSDLKEKRGADDSSHEEQSKTTGVKRRRVLQLESSDENETDDGGLDAKHSAPTTSSATSGKKSSGDSGKPVASSVEKKDKDDEDDAQSESYLADTDVDDEGASGGGSPSMLANYEGTNDFFDGLVFFFHELNEGSNIHQRKDVERIIRLHSGIIESSHTDKVEYILTDGKEWMEDFAEALSENPNLTFVRWEWIVECEKKNEMISVDPFVIAWANPMCVELRAAVFGEAVRFEIRLNWKIRIC
ncbi:unnamed protein product [Allacma fusca]|uniref:BRCT domain-containing protein n=1 Tax=Allacma fusca TaxID=39272 RepID=A0A8J2PIP0_9HEXA|nr:unnamed protein product [Allacma fusca]